MLNISDNNNPKQDFEQFKTVQMLDNKTHYKILNKIIIGISILGIAMLFLPWTQNISGSGAVTTLKPNQRP